MKDYCPNCNKITSIEEVHNKEKFFIKKEEIEVESSLMKCLECEELFENGQQELSNYSLAVDTYRKHHKLLTTSDIVAIREKYGMSQRLLCRLFGWTDSLVCQYENGKIQDNAHNDLLQFIDSPIAMLKYFINHRDNRIKDGKLSATEAKELSLTIKPLVEIEDKQDKILTLSEYYEQVASEYTGRNYFNYEKLVSLIQYIAAKVEDLSQTKLFKLLFYIDFNYYKNNKRSITGIPYCKFQFGPVPDNYEKFINILRFSDNLKVEDQFDDEGTKIFISNCKEIEMKEYSKGELENIDMVISQLKDVSAKGLSDFSHEEVAYQATEDRQFIDYKFAESLILKFD